MLTYWGNMANIANINWLTGAYWTASQICKHGYKRFWFFSFQFTENNNLIDRDKNSWNGLYKVKNEICFFSYKMYTSKKIAFCIQYKRSYLLLFNQYD